MALKNDIDVRSKAIEYLSRREHSRSELTTKLLEKAGTELDADIVESVLDELEQERLLNDQRCADALVRNALAKGYGPLKLRHQIREKGINSACLGDSLAYQEGDWFALATQVRLKKFGSTRPLDFKDKAKQARFLSGRGFGQEHIEAALSDSSLEVE